MSRGWANGILVCSLMALSIAAAPYKIVRPKIHEMMTIASKRCLDYTHNRLKPERCIFDLVDEGRTDRTWTLNVAPTLRGKYPDLTKAVRWSDDPTQQIGLKSGIKFWMQFDGLKVCERLARKKEDGRNNINDGITCNTHYGSMQFFHAQASVPGEPAAETHYKIMKWAGFLYDVASREISDDSLDVEYCKYFGGDDAFSRAMLPDTNVVPCGSSNREAWTLTTFFTMKCRGAFSSSRCPDEDSADRFGLARIYATGAILHLIQDSYSQAHCLRGECVQDGDKIVSIVQCSPITLFTTYLGQDPDRHSDADKRPLATANCIADDRIDDPVTAGAKALWHVRNRSPKEDFLRDLQKVFGTALDADALPGADAGQCFKGKNEVSATAGQ